jgi:hypothetical protein
MFQKAPVYCKQFRNARELVKKKEITDFIFAKLIDKTWTVSDGKSRKYDKVFFKKSFIQNIPEINNENIIVDNNNIQLAPDIIELENNEKFKDADGKIINIQTRGERKIDNIYFKVKDISNGFNIAK